MSRIDAYLSSYRWLGPLCLVGVAINGYCAIADLRYPSGWWSYLFGTLSALCAGVCAWAWVGHRRLARAVAKLPPEAP